MAKKEMKIITVEEKHIPVTSNLWKIQRSKRGKHVGQPQQLLVRKLWWSTLGLQFNWSKRNYDLSLPHNKIPDALATPAKKMAIPAMPSGEEFKPEATIVNYYGPSDMLGGHVDDMEADWTKAIVSLSLGCKCIFLFGGKMRDEVTQCSRKVVILY